MFNRAHLIQNDRKPLDSVSTQRWTLQPGGYISPPHKDNYVLHISGHWGIEHIEGANVVLHRKTKIENGIKDELKRSILCKSKRGDDHAERSKQRWMFEPELKSR